MLYSSGALRSSLAILNCPEVVKIGLMGGVAEGPPDTEQLRGKGEIQSR